ncbi:MAG: hypothetical protein IJT63_04435 [Lachnospiraceae bacterium]|nr:hypothetical protein [Lachnospiraceae bacterium]
MSDTKDYFKYSRHYKSKDLDDTLNHIRWQIDFLCWTAARMNYLLDASYESDNEQEKEQESEGSGEKETEGV